MKTSELKCGTHRKGLALSHGGVCFSILLEHSVDVCVFLFGTYFGKLEDSQEYGFGPILFLCFHVNDFIRFGVTLCSLVCLAS